jgi:hypothetical protein
VLIITDLLCESSRSNEKAHRRALSGGTLTSIEGFDPVLASYPTQFHTSPVTTIRHVLHQSVLEHTKESWGHFDDEC